MTEMCKWGCLWRGQTLYNQKAELNPLFLKWHFNTGSVNFIKCLCWYLPCHVRDFSLFLLHSTEARKGWCLIFHWNHWNREILTEMTKLFKCVILSSNSRLCKSSPLKDLGPNNLLKITLKLCIRVWGLTPLLLDTLVLLETDTALHSRWGGKDVGANCCSCSPAPPPCHSHPSCPNKVLVAVPCQANRAGLF